MPKTRGTDLVEGVLYRDGEVCIAPLPGGSTLYAWWYDPSYGGGDRRRGSLGTRDLKVAVERLTAFRGSGFDIEFLKGLRRGGIVQPGHERDPLLADLMADFLKSPEHTGSWISAARMVHPTIKRLCSGTRISLLTPKVQQAIIRDVYARGYAAATVIHVMQYIARVVNWGAGGDDDAQIRCLSRPKIISSPYRVCKVLDVPEPEKRNWHPDPDGMARVLALLADDEPMRRWSLTVLTFASRVEAALEAGGAQLHGELFHLNPRGRRQQDSKWRPTLPVAWSSLGEFRSWGSGRWVEGLTVQSLGKRLRAVGQQLGMPQLCPSCFRDYASSALRHADIDFPVRPVDKEHREKWMGHRKFADISDGYGRFRPDFLINPRVATEAFLRDLDRRSGGALFRQGSDKRPLLQLYPPRAEERAEIAYWRAQARGYGSVAPVSDNDDDPDPGSSGIQSDLPGATRGTWVVLGARQVSEGETGPIAGPFRQITGKVDAVDCSPDAGTFQDTLDLLAEYGIRLYEREVSGNRELFLAAPADVLVPVSTVPDLLRLARPRLRWPKRLPGNPKIGRRKRLRPQTVEEAATPPANLPHRVSISGLHMVLAAGVVFWLVRAGLALVPVLALAWPIKKIAAGTAMLGVTAYCAFSGWDVAAERALIMTLVMLGAILVDRPALSLRNLALAAILALAREPEALLGPSFQMSFGAVAGLIACAPLIDGRVFRTDSSSRILRAASWVAKAVVGTLATTLVAQLATAPFATYHFQTVQPFGLVGNALTLPLVSLAVMPAAVLGMLAYPFALDRPVWWLMGLAVRGMLDISAWIAGFGQANVVLPAFGTGALMLLAAALLLATLPVSRLRLLALVPAGLGVALAASPIRYDIYIERDGAGAAVRGKDGRLVVLGRPPGFVLEQWLKADGDARRPEAATAAAGPRCDRIGCTLTAVDGRAVALVMNKRAFAEDCARADILITRLRAPPGCAAPLIADRTFLAVRGATAIRLGTAGPEIVTARGAGQPKPWQPRPASAATPATEAGPQPPNDPSAADPSDPPPSENPQ
ncbi:UNVERIFIED_ORG: ComEC/Rec2-related protein [Methylobacterium sp. SuP10 SLI 274]|nr:ComEC/Rec2-related protein [Methylorubrum extorquens]MDF9791067.1 ComEC/Rec2-related protein [Methylorubrum extorquens]MDF9862771.1 ComEC/Rec2-related protein [Methylorubrum pseudosasae]MDH6636382.1 ComEC/Rec2-related protein [Methylobacterium sp. SuP10 SLI 274]MDH6665560.1 ComEC/Rec2-related protein [Methylorubrum zatmanii]